MPPTLSPRPATCPARYGRHGAPRGGPRTWWREGPSAPYPKCRSRPTVDGCPGGPAGLSQPPQPQCEPVPCLAGPPSISHDASRMHGRCEPPSTRGWCRGAALALWCGAHSWDMVILGEAVDAGPQSQLCCGPLRGLGAPRLPLHTPGERGDPAPSPLPASASRPLPPLLCAAAGEQTAHAGG